MNGEDMLGTKRLMCVEVERMFVRPAAEQPAISGNHGLNRRVTLAGMDERHGNLQDTRPTDLLQHVLKCHISLPEIG